MTQDQQKICPTCGAECSPDQVVCWLCLKDLPSKDLGDLPEQEKTPMPDMAAAHRMRGGASSFSIMSLMMLVTLVAVCLGAFTVAPGLGISLCILSTPALIRTVVLSIRQKRQGLAASPAYKLSVFAASLAAVVTAGVATTIGFFGTCFAVCYLHAGSGASMDRAANRAVILGGLVGLFLGIFVLYRFWRKR